MNDWTPVIAQLTILVTAGIVLVKKILPDFAKSKIEESEKMLADKLSKSEYDRARATFREDSAFDMLGSTLDWLKKQAEENRKETERRYDVISNLGKGITNLANTISKNGDIIRILAQNSAQMTDRLESIEREIHEIKQ